MKYVYCFCVLLLLTQQLQAISKKDKHQIQQLMQSFMSCIEHKDSVRFYDLFYPGSVAWAGGFKSVTQAKRLAKDSTKSDYFISSHQSFYRSLSGLGNERERFFNVQISGDEAIATVIFDYVFEENNVVQNWGKESWALLKVNGQWKICSVLFSFENAKWANPPKFK